MTGLFQVTVQFSNAVLVAILPHVNDAAKSLNLPMQGPVTTNHVRQFRCDPRENHLGGVVFLNNGFTFWFDRGIIYGVESPHCYFHLQDPDEIPRFYGPLRCNQDEAVRIGLRAIAALGHDISKLDIAKAQAEAPPRIGTNTVPHFRISWPGPPDFFGPTAEVEVNGDKRCVEMVWLYGAEFSRPPPKINVSRPSTPKNANAPSGGIPLEKVSDERQNQILKAVLPEMSAYAKRLKLPVPTEIKTNTLNDIQCGLINGEPHVQVTFTNGYRLSYTWGFVSSFYAPDCFFTYDWKQRGKTSGDFTGPVPQRLEPLEEVARKALKATGHFKDPQFLETKPIFSGGPEMTNKMDLARFLFTWQLPGKLSEAQKAEIPPEFWPNATVEVDSKTMTVQSVFILDPKR